MNKVATEATTEAVERHNTESVLNHEGLENMVLVMLEQLQHRVSKEEVAAVLERNRGDVLNTMRELESMRSVEQTQELGIDNLVTAIQIHFASFIPRQTIVDVLEKHGGSVVEAMSELQSLSQSKQQQQKDSGDDQNQQQHKVCFHTPLFGG